MELLYPQMGPRYDWYLQLAVTQPRMHLLVALT